MPAAPKCPYCGKSADLVSSADLYFGEAASARPFLLWRCHACDAHVRCRGTSTQPDGELVDALTRSARSEAARAISDLIGELGGGRSVHSLVRSLAGEWAATAGWSGTDLLLRYTTEAQALAVRDGARLEVARVRARERAKRRLAEPVEKPLDKVSRRAARPVLYPLEDQ